MKPRWFRDVDPLWMARAEGPAENPLPEISEISVKCNLVPRVKVSIHLLVMKVAASGDSLPGKLKIWFGRELCQFHRSCPISLRRKHP